MVEAPSSISEGFYHLSGNLSFGLQTCHPFELIDILQVDVDDEGVSYLGSTLSLEDLKRVDIWALGQVFYCLINPGVSYPFEREGADVSQIMLMHRQRKSPSADPKYQPKQTTVWSRVHAAFEACTKHNPSERPSATGVLVVLHSRRYGNRHGIGTKF